MASQAQTQAQRRAGLEQAAQSRLRAIATELMEAIAEHTDVKPVATPRQDAWNVTLGSASLTIDRVLRVPTQEHSGLGSNIDVVMFTKITVLREPDRSGYKGRSHSLWFCDAQQQGKYAWYETTFMDTPGLRAPMPPVTPHALTPEQATGALGNWMDVKQVAWPFTQLIPGELDEFLDRWLGWLASAANSTLTMPTMLPERDAQGSWRN